MKDVAEEFEKRYQAWKAFTESGPVNLSSLSDDYINNPQFDAIVDLGPDAVPFIIEKLDTDEGAHFLIHALERITHKKFSAEEIANGQARYGVPLGNQGYAAMWRDWWNERNKN